MAYSGDIVYTVVFLDPEQYETLTRPYYKPVAYQQSPLLVNEEWDTPIIDIMPRMNGRLANILYRVNVKPDLIQPVVQINQAI